MPRKTKSTSNFFATRSIFLYILLIVIVLALSWGTISYWRDKHHSSTPQPVTINQGTANPNPNVPGGQNQSSNPPAGGLQSKDTSGNVQGPTLSPDIQPAAPTGQFVSNHQPSLSRQNTETSICTTTPGAYCQVRFTSGGVVKYLTLEKTNADGSYFWNNWTLQDIGITQGTWQITAVAINGSKTATSQDALQLVVGP